MGVNVREAPKGSGVYYVFINHKGTRKSKKIGTDEKLANEVAEKIKAKLLLNELDVEKINEKTATFEEAAKTWLALPHDWRESTRELYMGKFDLHIYPAFKNCQLNEISRKNLKTFFDKLLIKKLSVDNIKQIKHLLNGVLSHAVDSELTEHQNHF
jgi:integrase